MIDIIKLYQDFNIHFRTEGKGVARGWVGISCPFCSGNPGYHLGYCIDQSNKYSGAYTCWRCGGKNTKKVIAKITNSTESEAWKIMQRYSSDSVTKTKEIRKTKKAVKCLLPVGLVPIKGKLYIYLKKRKFEVKELISTWDIRGTGPVGPYKHRIIAPIYFKKQLVSFQGRDITGKSDMKYKACPKDLEVRDHKNCLYGYDLARKSSVVVCEGITDVWRLGPGSVATFGIKFTDEQVRLLSKFKKVFILFDTDSEAVTQAELLGKLLSAVGVDVEIIYLDNGDPGELLNEEAKQLMKDLIG